MTTYDTDPARRASFEAPRLSPDQKQAFFDEAARLLPPLPEKLDPDTLRSYSQDRVEDSFFVMDNQNISVTGFIVDNDGKVEHNSVTVGFVPAPANPQEPGARRYVLTKPTEGALEGADYLPSMTSGPLSEVYDEVMDLMRKLGPEQQVDHFPDSRIDSLLGLK